MINDELKQLADYGCFRISVCKCVVCHQAIEWWTDWQGKVFLLTAANLQSHYEICDCWSLNRQPVSPVPKLEWRRGMKSISGGKRVKSATKMKSVRPRWTAAEVKFLKAHYRSWSNADIADALNRKVSSVVFKGHRMGLSKSQRRLREMGRENIAHRWGAPARAKRGR